MANGKTVLIQKKAVKGMIAEASRLKADFKDYLEDLELFSDPEFWNAVEEVQQGKLKKFESVKEMLAELDA
ncbi:MAG: hypothetical protein V1494_00850 [Candidatus Diapherotrites archaeon]